MASPRASPRAAVSDIYNTDSEDSEEENDLHGDFLRSLSLSLSLSLSRVSLGSLLLLDLSRRVVPGGAPPTQLCSWCDDLVLCGQRGRAIRDDKMYQAYPGRFLRFSI